jgi:hypothetical protein
MVVRRTSGAMASFLKGISRFLQAFANRPFGSLCTMFNSFPGGRCPMLHCLTCFFRSFLNRLTSFLYWTLIVRSQCERDGQ